MSISEDQILKKLTEIFSDILEVDDLQLTRNMTMADVEGWDSLANVRLMVATEREFDIRFETEELASVDNVGALIDFVQKKTN